MMVAKVKVGDDRPGWCVPVSLHLTVRAPGGLNLSMSHLHQETLENE